MERTPEIVEQLKFTDKGTAWSGRAEEPGEAIRHLPTGYTVVSDETKEGTRTITLQEIDRTERNRKMKGIVEAIATALKGGKAFKDLLMDIFEDSWDEEIDRLYQKVVEKKEPVVAEPGCFKLIIGTGSKQVEVMLRD